MAVRGGQKLKRFLREAKRHQGKKYKIQIGFKNEGGNNIAGLAAVHEFGLNNAKISIPERPAFRNGIEEAKRKIKPLEIKLAKANKGYLTDSDIVKIGKLAHEIIVQSYLNFHGAELSELQKERKAGTPYEDTQLIGSEGPKMIEHISLWINDKLIE